MSIVSEALWNALTPASEALAADRAALADPRADGSVIGEIVCFLAHLLDYDPDIYYGTLRGAAKKLLEGCLGDVETMWNVLDARAANERWRQGVIRRQVKPWFVVDDLIGDYARQVAQERKTQATSTEWQEASRRSREYHGKDAAYWAELEKKHLAEKS